MGGILSASAILPPRFEEISMLRLIMPFCLLAFIHAVSQATEIVPRPKTQNPEAAARPTNAAKPSNEELPPSADEHRLLAEKLAQRDRLQREIDSLSEKLLTSQQICVEVEMWEVDLSEMRNRGLDFKFNAKDYQSSREDPNLLGLVQELRKNNFSKLLFAPTLVTVSGRPASFFVGTQLPIPAAGGSIQAVEYIECGQHLDLLPVALGNNKVRIDVRAKVSTGGEHSDTIEVSAERAPTLEELGCDTTVEMAFGETVMLSGLIRERVTTKQTPSGLVEEIGHVQLMVVLTADTVSPKVAESVKRKLPSGRK
jgi:hypothetical protein